MSTDTTNKRTSGDIAGASGTPDAIEAATVTTSPAELAGDPAVRRGRGVEWVRPTDLAARGSARAAGAGIDFQADLARRTRHLTATSARTLAERVRRLPPLSAFGRRGADRGVERGAVGMT